MNCLGGLSLRNIFSIRSEEAQMYFSFRIIVVHYLQLVLQYIVQRFRDSMPTGHEQSNTLCQIRNLWMIAVDTGLHAYRFVCSC